MRTKVRNVIDVFSPNCPRCRSPRVQLGYGSASLSQRVFGLNELLCNNCGLTFTGFSLPGAIKRAPSGKKELAGNRQLSPRYKLRVPVSMAISESDSWSGESKLSPRLDGQTRDISRIGLAIVVPDFQRFGYDFADTGHRLVVTVSLPTATIDLRAAPVRLEKLNHPKGPQGWLIGIRITKMTDRDCAHWISYFDSLASRGSFEGIESRI